MKTQNDVLARQTDGVLACLRADVDMETVNPDLFFYMFKTALQTWVWRHWRRLGRKCRSSL
jgi:hypothetical protein